MKSFFNLPEEKAINRKTNSKEPCKICGLYKKCKSPKMEYSGNGKLKILVLAEAQGKTEDEKGIQLIGEAGQLFRKRLKKYNLNLDEDFWKINSICCRPPGNRKPTRKELKCCWPRVEKAIKDLKPNYIWLMGGTAVESFYQGIFTDLTINRWRGLCIPDFKVGAYVFPMFHPSYLLRNQYDENLSSVFDRDIENALNKNCSIPPLRVNPNVEIIKDFSDIKELLTDIYKKYSLIAFDYETSSLKPFGEDQKIWSISVALSENFSFSFPLEYPHWGKSEKEKIYFWWMKILTCKGIKKIAHNLKFEDLWSRVFFQIDKVESWKWCTMNMAHIIDNRTKFSGLKFQTYINYGVRPYDEDVKKYISSDENGINRLYQVPLDKLLKYGGLDALFTFKLYKDQQRYLRESPQGKKLKRAYLFFHQGLLALSDIQIDGIKINENYYQEQDRLFERKIKRIENKLQEGREAEQFRKSTGRVLNIRSDKDLRELFFKVMKLDSVKDTASGVESVDKFALERINVPFVKRLMELRKADKIKGTYLAQFMREVYKGGMNPFFDLHTAKSFRSCVAKGTKILIPKKFKKYPDGVPIEKIKKGDYVYCFDENLRPQIKKVLWAGKTGYRKVIRIYWTSRGGGGSGYLDLTPEHKVRMINGKYIEARNLLKVEGRNYKQILSRYSKASVLSCSRKGEHLNFTGHLKNGNGILEHRFIYEKFIGELKEKEVVHHKNKNHLDHRVNNLEKMTLSEHSKIHSVDTLLTPQVRENNRIAVIKGWKEGKYINSVKRGEEHPDYLGLSKFYCLILLMKAKGQVAKTKYDFGTIKGYLKKHDINPELVKIRFDKYGRYISKNRLRRLSKLGISKAQKIIGHNYYKLLKLYSQYGISTKRKWANQFGEFVPGNHHIIKIEQRNEYKEVYDIEVEESNNFIANQICVHNSSSRPNFQNIPVRDEEAKKVTRGGIIARKGNKIGEVDYRQLEVKIAACYTRDSSLIKYVTDPSADMHRDSAMDIWDLPKEEVSSTIRFYAKNNWVFPQFYGDWYKSCAKSLWTNCINLKTNSGITLNQHLKNEKKNSYSLFENHCKDVENIFWKERFREYKKWKDKINKEYRRNGFISSYLGFRFVGYMGYKDVTNYPIQGTAFHCLLWSLIRIMEIAKEENWKTRIIGQIHDSIVFDLCPEEEKYVLKTIKRVMEKDIREEFDWIIVPLEVEFEVSPIDGSWYEKKEVKV